MGRRMECAVLLMSAVFAGQVIAQSGDARIVSADTVVRDTGYVVRRGSLLDLGVYGGGAVTSRWFEAGGDAYKVGYAPIVGFNATFWTTPSLGIRLHGAYMPSHVPFASDGFFDIFPEEDAFEPGRYVLNNYFYDLSLVFRPFHADSAARWWRNAYFFAGGGGLTTDPAGDPRPCVLGARGVCLPYRPEAATVGQVTAGAGMTLLGLGERLSLFGELGFHGYDSPVHVPENSAAEDRFALTTRLVIGLSLSVGSRNEVHVDTDTLIRERYERVVLPSDTVACINVDGKLREVPALRYPDREGLWVVRNGQVVQVQGLDPQDSVMLEGSRFYRENLPVLLNVGTDGRSRRFVQFGQPQVIDQAEMVEVGRYQDVTFYRRAGDPTPPTRVFARYRDRCTLQAFEFIVGIRG